ncbi:hypothetical protein TNCV_2025331 [Trichonephila clavipes]|nr:hypothetical protein TNCV_2025331 [Trichonephila clavipes]
MPSEVSVDRWKEVDGLQFVSQAYPTHALFDSSPGNGAASQLRVYILCLACRGSFTPAPRAANWSHCSLYPATNQRAPLSSQPKQKLFKTYHPDKAQKPRLPDPIIQPIAVMPPSRTKNPTFAMPLIEDLSRNGIEDCSYSPEAQKSNAYSTSRGSFAYVLFFE